MTAGLLLAVVKRLSYPVPVDEHVLVDLYWRLSACIKSSTKRFYPSAYLS